MFPLWNHFESTRDRSLTAPVGAEPLDLWRPVPARSSLISDLSPLREEASGVRVRTAYLTRQDNRPWPSAPNARENGGQALQYTAVTAVHAYGPGLFLRSRGGSRDSGGRKSWQCWPHSQQEGRAQPLPKLLEFSFLSSSSCCSQNCYGSTFSVPSGGCFATKE